MMMIIAKEYNKSSIYKELEIEIEKMWHLKTTFVSVIVGDLGMMKKKTNKHINKIHSSSNQYKMQKLHFVELLIS